MIIFFESGRLGNQLFQYCAMRKFQRQGLILAIGMSDLKSVFQGVDLIHTTRLEKLLEWITRMIGEKRIDYAARKLHILTLVEEMDTSYKVTPGLIGQLVYFKAGYYQAENIVDEEITENITIKPEFITLAGQFLYSIKNNRLDCYFIHVRRGDYIGWPSRNAPAVLPLSWYREQIDKIRAANPNALFIMASDDIPYVDEFFSKEKDIVIARGDMMTDFAIMTCCLGGGILSASSFSWWASYFVRRANPNAFFIAPFYWGGHRLKYWHPAKIKTSWLNYAHVGCGEERTASIENPESKP